MGKCEAFDTEILLADGSVKTIEEIYRNKYAKLLTLQENYKFKLIEASDFIDDGIKPVFQVITRLGRQIKTTLTHPYLTIDGWKRLEELKVGSKIAVPRVINIFGSNEWRNCEVKILSYLLGDGSITNGSPLFIVGKPSLESDFVEAVEEFGGVEAVVAKVSNRTPTLRIRNSNKTAGNAITIWLRKLGVWGCNSHRKFIPDEVFTLKQEQVALFLNRLFSTDGWARVLTSRQVQLGFASVSERMIRQIQHLLLRFGVIAKLKKRSVKYKNERRIAWQLDITDALSIKTFIREIGIYGKEAALEQVLGALENRNYQTNSDLIPIEIWEKIAAGKGAESWSSLAKRAAIQGATNIHVGQRAPSRDRLAKFAAVLENDALKSLAESEVYWDEIVSIEYVGEQQVYDLTIPETHNFVANDICVHNTAFCLNIAQRAALQADAVVGFFSLEMSKEQLVMRMLCSEAMVDAHRFRNGFLSRQEWERLGEALGRLAETKIFIDDTPGISVLEMRAKARRLAAEQKRLDLIIVDYMQLMTGGNKRIESRQQEVSQISRELKGLAKELNVPLIALSQLSRAAENRSDHKPQLSDLRESGCLTGDSLITLAETGEVIPISNLIGKSGFKVWALNKQTWKLEKAVVSNAFSTGRKSVFRLQTRLGRIIRATANHKFLAFAGWKRLDELQTGEFIALPRRISNSTEQTMSFAELGLLGHLIGDGCTLPRHAIQYTTREKDLAEIVASLAVEIFGDEIKPRIKEERQWLQVYLSSTRRHTHNVRSAVAEWLESLGVWGLRSYQKFIPEKVFRQPKAAIACFLRHLWATDGSVRLVQGKKARPSIYYATSSERLASDVQSLLLRLGINARLRTIPQSGKGRDQYHVIISGKSDLETFVQKVGAVGRYKTESLNEIAAFMVNRTENTNRDVIPNTIWRESVVPAMTNLKMTTRQMMEQINTAYCGTGLYKQNLSRARALRVAQVVSSDYLSALAESDVYWDEIVSIELDGEEEVYDLTVDNLHNFVANDIIVHNSIEQDADVVAFIFREEYYKPTDENFNQAEIIIAKQRNGPTGAVTLTFIKELTRFEDLYRGEGGFDG
jgi:replicative DNA helicase